MDAKIKGFQKELAAAPKAADPKAASSWWSQRSWMNAVCRQDQELGQTFGHLSSESFSFFCNSNDSHSIRCNWRFGDLDVIGLQKIWLPTPWSSGRRANMILSCDGYFSYDALGLATSNVLIDGFCFWCNF